MTDVRDELDGRCRVCQHFMEVHTHDHGARSWCRNCQRDCLAEAGTPVSRAIRAWVDEHGTTLRLWTPGGLLVGAFQSMDDEVGVLQLETILDGSRKRSTVCVVISSISAWA